jgi:hypothetical protein
MKKSSRKEFTVSENGVDCDLNYPTSYFTAHTIPSEDYPTPMYLFSRSGHTWLDITMNEFFRYIIGYFYVNEIAPKNSSAIIYYRMKYYSDYRSISEITTTPLDGNWTGNVVHVKSYRSMYGKSNYTKHR